MPHESVTWTVRDLPAERRRTACARSGRKTGADGAAVAGRQVAFLPDHIVQDLVGLVEQFGDGIDLPAGIETLGHVQQVGWVTARVDISGSPYAMLGNNRLAVFRRRYCASAGERIRPR